MQRGVGRVCIRLVFRRSRADVVEVLINLLAKVTTSGMSWEGTSIRHVFLGLCYISVNDFMQLYLVEVVLVGGVCDLHERDPRSTERDHQAPAVIVHLDGLWAIFELSLVLESFERNRVELR